MHPRVFIARQMGEEASEELTMRWIVRVWRDAAASREYVGAPVEADEQASWFPSDGESALHRQLRASRLVC